MYRCAARGQRQYQQRVLEAGSAAREAPGRTQWQQTRRMPLARQMRARCGQGAWPRGGAEPRRGASAATAPRRRGQTRSMPHLAGKYCGAMRNTRAGEQAAARPSAARDSPTCRRARAVRLRDGSRAASGCRLGRGSGHRRRAAATIHRSRSTVRCHSAAKPRDKLLILSSGRVCAHACNGAGRRQQHRRRRGRCRAACSSC